jgi:hypothetical protein
MELRDLAFRCQRIGEMVILVNSFFAGIEQQKDYDGKDAGPDGIASFHTNWFNELKIPVAEGKKGDFLQVRQKE